VRFSTDQTHVEPPWTTRRPVLVFRPIIRSRSMRAEPFILSSLATAITSNRANSTSSQLARCSHHHAKRLPDDYSLGFFLSSVESRPATPRTFSKGLRALLPRSAPGQQVKALGPILAHSLRSNLRLLFFLHSSIHQTPLCSRHDAQPFITSVPLTLVNRRNHLSFPLQLHPISPLGSLTPDTSVKRLDETLVEHETRRRSSSLSVLHEDSADEVALKRVAWLGGMVFRFYDLDRNNASHCIDRIRTFDHTRRRYKGKRMINLKRIYHIAKTVILQPARMQKVVWTHLVRGTI
jgi:hypothetical protein